jgi:hypothetical protein
VWRRRGALGRACPERRRGDRPRCRDWEGSSACMPSGTSAISPGVHGFRPRQRTGDPDERDRVEFVYPRALPKQTSDRDREHLRRLGGEKRCRSVGATVEAMSRRSGNASRNDAELAAVRRRALFGESASGLPQTRSKAMTAMTNGQSDQACGPHERLCASGGFARFALTAFAARPTATPIAAPASTSLG